MKNVRSNSLFLLHSIAFLVATTLLVSGCKNDGEDLLPPVNIGNSSTSTESGQATDSGQGADNEAPETPEWAQGVDMTTVDVATEISRITAIYEKQVADFQVIYQAATQEERKRMRESKPSPVPNAKLFAQHAIALAAAQPESPGLDSAYALIGLIAQSPDNRKVAIDLMFEKYSGSPEMQKLVARLVGARADQKAEDRLAQLLTSPNKEVRATALVGMAEYLKNLAGKRDNLIKRPQMSARIGDREYLDQRKVEPSEIESLYRDVVDNYADVDVKLRQQNVVDIATAALKEIESFGVGKLPPDISGEDIDGVAFSLSEYRGKVVLLTFWSNNVPRCQHLYPYYAMLAERLAAKPFAIIGVNVDKNLDNVREALVTHDIKWRSFWNGPEGPGSSIAKEWGVRLFPMMYLLDTRGVIQYKGPGGPELDEAIQRLLEGTAEPAAVTPEPATAEPTSPSGG